MIGKLFVVVLIAACIAVTEATVAVTTYSDNKCTKPIGFYSSSQGCSLSPGKRSVESGFSVCESYSADGPYYTVDMCNLQDSAPNVTVPDGLQSFKYSPFDSCYYGGFFEIIASNAPSRIPVMVYFNMAFKAIPFNITIACDMDTGIMSIESCIPDVGCASWDAVPNGVCTNITTTVDSESYYGIQTTCGTAPPMASPMAAPTSSTPIASPTSAPGAPVATPVGKKSGSVAVRSTTALSIIVGMAALVF